MKKNIALKWAAALCPDMGGGKYKKLIGRMSNGDETQDPTDCCCLGVLNEICPIKGYKKDRTYNVGFQINRLFNSPANNGRMIFDRAFADLNDTGYKPLDTFGPGGYIKMSHPDIANLILLAIESGEIENV